MLFPALQRGVRLFFSSYLIWFMASTLIPALDGLSRNNAQLIPDLAMLEPYHLSILDYQREALWHAIKRDFQESRIHRPSAEIRDLIRAYGKHLRAMHDAATKFRIAHELNDYLGMAEAEVAFRRAQQFQLENQGALEKAVQLEVSAELVRASIAGPGSPFPPVWFRMVSPPLLITFSPRHEIQPMASYFLLKSTPIFEIEAFEEFSLVQLNLSSLVEPTGGTATYPATVALSLPDLQTLFEVVAHEWFHNYLTFRPLGVRYLKSTSHRTLNETAATIVGEEISRRLMLRHYRDLYLPDLPIDESAAKNYVGSGTDLHLNARQEKELALRYALYETRMQVDIFLADGLVEEAEEFMEGQRKLINARGHNLRKLNQAFFAFHGTYATRPGSTSEIGSQLEDLRALSSNLGSFVRTVQALRNESDLKQALIEAQKRAENKPAG